jgi:hypothetical protein
LVDDWIVKLETQRDSHHPSGASSTGDAVVGRFAAFQVAERQSGNKPYRAATSGSKAKRAMQ